MCGEWYYSPDHGQLCHVVEARALWGETICRVWLPGRDSVVRVPASRLQPLDSAGTGSPDYIAYVVAAARVADALHEDVLLAPIESSVIPLPHQIRALSRAVTGGRVRYLLADEVGLGKTIEAGLIMRELKLRGLVTRTLVVAPKGLLTQWVAEMRLRFGEEFRLFIPGEFSVYRQIAGDENIWRNQNQVVCSMDSVKPLDGRRGWSNDQVAEYNRERFEDLIAAGWDLVIVDEAHRLAGSTEQVARHRLGRGLAEAAPYVLLLSATPHQGKTDAFHRLVSLLDAQGFPDVESVSRERVRPYVVRTEKRRAIDVEGKPLFKPRRTELVPISWEARHQDQHRLYQAVTEYVRDGYNQARQEKRSYIGFLMILMQRLVVSSTSAIRTTLGRRLEALDTPPEQLSLFPLSSEDEWADLDGQQQVDTLLGTRLKALRNEYAEVKLLLSAASRCEQTGPDAKAEALLDWIYRLQAEEGHPDLKVLVFTEFVPTQGMLHRFLAERGFAVVCLNGSMDMEERKRVQEAFAGEARILLSTDAGGEGLNLQFCHVVVNYDIPWNPMKLEQRIGRVDRIGQGHTVRAVNFVLKGTVEHRVLEVLEEKLSVIFKEFGIDKTGDVLDSAYAGQLFDDLYIEAILQPDAVEAAVESLVKRIYEEAREARESSSILGGAEDLDPHESQRLLAHPLPHWVERMTVSYLKAHGGKAERKNRTWALTWPDGETVFDAVFTGKEAEEISSARHLTLEEPRVRGLAMRLPRFVPGQPVPVIALSSLAPEISGFWSLWQVSLLAEDWSRRRTMPLFLSDGDAVYLPTARHLWNELLTSTPVLLRYLDTEESKTILQRVSAKAEHYGKTLYDELVEAHRAHLARERDKGEYSFASRRKGLERIGLPQVRFHRLKVLEQEERSWREDLRRKAEIVPEIVPLLLVRVEGGCTP